MKIAGKTQVILLVAIIIVIVAILGYFFFIRPNNAYKTVIGNADKSYSAQNYTEAKKLYNEASAMKPGESYPLLRIKSIDSIFDVRERGKRYNDKIAQGDELFNQQDYENARKAYFDAVNIDPDKTYPIDQIRKIDQLLAAGQPQKPEPASHKNYHIVVGSFELQPNAEQLNTQLLNEGFKSYLIPRDEYGMIAVTAGTYGDIHTAWNHLSDAREQFGEDTWILFYEFK